jgi:hypothetical protein
VLSWASVNAAAILGTAVLPFEMNVNGVNIISRVDRRSIKMRAPGPGENGVLMFTVLDPDSSIDIVEWDHVRFIDNADARPVQFGGFVMHVRTHVWARGGRTHQVRVTGYGVLLDLRVIPAMPNGVRSSASGAQGFTIGHAIAYLAGQFGGIITGTVYEGDHVDHDVQATATQTILSLSDWIFDPTQLFGVAPGWTSPKTLRNAIEYWGDWGIDTRSQQPAPYIYWVDSYARLHFLWIPADAPDDSYEGFGTAFSDATANAPQDEAWLEGDGSDLRTSVWVDANQDGGDTWVRYGGHPVAGDLEDTISATIALGESSVDHIIWATLAGIHELEQRAGAAMVSQIIRRSTTPLNYRVGMGLDWTSAQLGLSAQTLRIVGLAMEFESHNMRKYTLDVGGRLRPSLAREHGRYALRSR